jgi:hypothetical protein
MLTFRRFPMFYCEIDAAAVGGSAEATAEVTTTETGTGGQQEGAAKTDGNAQAAEQTESPEVARLKRDLARSHRALSTLQKERDELRGKQTDKPQESKTDAPAQKAGDTHPALIDRYGRPLEKDEDGRVYDPQTESFLPPGVLIERYNSEQKYGELMQKFADFETKFTEKERNETEAQYQAREAEAHAGFVKSIESTISNVRKEILPDRGEAINAIADRNIGETLQRMADEAKADGVEVAPADLYRLIREATLAERDYISASFDAQTRDNATYKEQHPVKPGGQPGSSVTKNQMPTSPADRDKRAREVAARLEAEMMQRD